MEKKNPLLDGKKSKELGIEKEGDIEMENRCKVCVKGK